MPLLFTEADYRRRLEAVQGLMERDDLEVAVFTSVHNIAYLSGFFYGQPYGRWGAVVVPPRGEPALVVPRIEAGRAREFTWLPRLLEYTDAEPPERGLARLTAEAARGMGFRGGRVGVEEDTLPVALARALGEALGGPVLVDISAPVERLRLVKSAEEVEVSRQLARLCEAVLRGLDGALRPGLTELEAELAGERALREAWARVFPQMDYVGDRVRVVSGGRIWGHHGALGRRIGPGELVALEATPIVGGYFSTLTRQRFVGRVPPEVQRAYNIVLEAYQSCLSAIRPGVPFAQIDLVAQEVFARHGMERYKGFGTGHSHGLMGPFWGREKPGEYRPYNTTTLEEGVITSLEPSLFIPGVGPIWVNDMVLVTATGAEVLTHYPLELREVPA